MNFPAAILDKSVVKGISKEWRTTWWKKTKRSYDDLLVLILLQYCV